MKAIVVDEDDQSLQWTDVPTPEPGPGEVRIKAAATSCNRADLLQRRGLYPPPKGASTILGLDVSGVIDAVGPGVEQWSTGDPVCALLSGGGYAEYVVSPASLVLPVHKNLRLVDAAAIPEVFFTAFVNLCLEAELANGETVLVHAAASGVGTALIQLCRAFGSTVFGTASRPKLDFLAELGIDAAIDRESEDFSARVDELTDHGGVDIIIDPVGAGYFPQNLHLLADRGRLVIIGLLAGSESEISLGRLLRKRLRVIGSVLRSRSLEEKSAIAEAFRATVWPLFEDGTVQPVIDRVMPIEQVEDAHELLTDNATIGKVVLTVEKSL